MGLGCLIGHALHNNDHHHGNHHDEATEDLLAILKNRLVKGEITEEKYLAIKKIILSN